MSAHSEVSTAVTTQRSSNWLVRFWASTVGKKIVMGVTGVIGFLFVLFHMAGNLNVFIGSKELNNYSALLKSNVEVLWTARIVLLIAVILHIAAAAQLSSTSVKARKVGYKTRQNQMSTFASRTMRWTGPLLLLFIIFHLLHFTTGTLHNDFVDGDVFHNVISAFQIWWISAIYIVAMLCLSLHLDHGIWSMFQSLGLNHPRYNKFIRAFASLLTIIIIAGFIAIPVAVLLGYGS